MLLRFTEGFSAFGFTNIYIRGCDSGLFFYRA